LKLSVAEPIQLNQVYLGLGSNIDPQRNLPLSVALLGEQVKVKAVSNVWETPPVGISGSSFLNAATRVATELDQIELKDQILRPIETRLKRIRTGNPNISRTIDLDILIFNDILVDNDIWIYAYICVPMAELNPGYTHLLTGETIRQAAERLKQNSPIKLSSVKLQV
jgi:2-amino-4-hydroxy-6-hydroxymethyldihydropteridine diphosphokinase